ncbi:hypothetical protein SDC9_132948 [bioreactor metagenome]|uniref:Uncharacterized protein n=1 Tax=bioreactor metagenome TaxID=1076179 RepID=A0A645D9H7_9ZZZZ
MVQQCGDKTGARIPGGMGKSGQIQRGLDVKEEKAPAVAGPQPQRAVNTLCQSLSS